MNTVQRVEPVHGERNEAAAPSRKGARLSVRDWLIGVFYALLLMRCWDLYSTLDRVPRQVDEPYHLQGTYFYKLLFVDRDFTNKDWSTFLAYDQPLVGEYILGFALQCFNGKTVDTIGGEMDWHRRCIQDWFRTPLVAQQTEASPPQAAKDHRLIAYCDTLLKQIKTVPATPLGPDDYRTGQRTVLLFALLAALLMIVIGCDISRNRIVGMVAGLVFISNPVAIPGFQQVLTDSFWCFFVLLCLVLLFRLFHAMDRRENWAMVALLSVASGISLALALGTKLIAAYMAVVICLCFFADALLIIRRARNTGGAFPVTPLVTRFAGLILITIAAGLVFILLNPFLYHDCIGHSLVMLRHREEIMRIQSAVQGPAIHSLAQRVEAIFGYGILLGYSMDGWSRVGAALFYIWVLGEGAGRLARNVRDELRAAQFGPNSIVLVWVVTSFVMVGSLLNMEWSRYFLPLVMCTVLVFALGVETVGTKAVRLLGRRFVARNCGAVGRHV